MTVGWWQGIWLPTGAPSRAALASPKALGEQACATNSPSRITTPDAAAARAGGGGGRRDAGAADRGRRQADRRAATSSITTPDGQCDAYFVAPSCGKHPAVLIWPDIMGLRPAFRKMADRLAQSGYAVLVVNQFYRSTKSPFLAAGESFDQPAVRDRIMPWRAALTAGGDDQRRQGLPRLPRPAEGGRHQARHRQHRLLHGRADGDAHRGGAAGAGACRCDLPRRRAGQRRARQPAQTRPADEGGYLIAIASNDDARSPNDKVALREAFAAAKLPAEIEVYDGTMHGWCPLDSKVYNPPQAERAWARMLALFAKTPLR